MPRVPSLATFTFNPSMCRGMTRLAQPDENIGKLDQTPRPFDSHLLDQFAALPQASCVGQADRNPSQRNRDFDVIARRAGNIRYNRPVVSN